MEILSEDQIKRQDFVGRNVPPQPLPSWRRKGDQ